MYRVRLALPDDRGWRQQQQQQKSTIKFKKKQTNLASALRTDCRVTHNDSLFSRHDYPETAARCYHTYRPKSGIQRHHPLQQCLCLMVCRNVWTAVSMNMLGYSVKVLRGQVRRMRRWYEKKQMLQDAITSAESNRARSSRYRPGIFASSQWVFQRIRSYLRFLLFEPSHDLCVIIQEGIHRRGRRSVRARRRREERCRYHAQPRLD